MLLLWTLGFFLAVAPTKAEQVQIENKNINVNVNVNAKEIAEELWKIIELHLKHNENSITRRLMQEDAVGELEEIIRRVVEPTRRLNPIAEIELAKNYERIVRRALPIFGWNRSSLDPLANVDDVVDDMMWATKTLVNQPSKTTSSIDEPVRGQLPVTDYGEATWSFTLRRIMKSLKNIENSLQIFGQQLAIDRMSPTIFAEPSSSDNPYIRRPSKAKGRSKNNENLNKNYNVIKSALASNDHPSDDDDELYNGHRSEASDLDDLVDEHRNIPHEAADETLSKQKQFMHKVIGGFDSKMQEGMQDVIQKRRMTFPSTVENLENLENLMKSKKNSLTFGKRPDKRRPAEYRNPAPGKTMLKNKSMNKNINENENIINFGKKDNYRDKSKTVKIPDDDDDDDYDYENHI